MNRRGAALPLLAVVGVVAAGHLSLVPRVADLDGFYHMGHALLYGTTTPFDPSLPWATRSIIRELGGDLWWGFHVLLIPFATLLGVETGQQVVALLLTLTLGLTVFWVLRRHGVRGAGWWAALFLVAVPNIFFRYLMVRPHVVSLSLSLLLLSFLVRGRVMHVVAVSAAISWVHLNLIWLPPALALTYAVGRILADGPGGRGDTSPSTSKRPVPIVAALVASGFGGALGWILRPDPMATLALLRVQLVQLFALKASDAPLTFALELMPIDPGTLLRSSGLFAPAWLVGMMASGVVYLRTRREDPDERATSPVVERVRRERLTLLLTVGLASSAFLVVALLSARRAMEQWVAFGVLLLPLLSTLVPKPGPRLRAVGLVGLLVLVGGHLVWGASRHALNVREVAFPVSTMENAAAFLADRSDEGDVVFHARWDNFGPLFARNRVNRYLGGMDPVFQFAYDPALYWEFFYLSTDATTEYTCDAFPCRTGVATDTHTALRRHFDARWILVEPARNPRLSLYLLDDPRYRLALETRHEAVFEILPADAEAGAGGGP